MRWILLILVGEIVRTLAELQDRTLYFFEVGEIDHGTHVPGPVAQSSADTEYNAACTAVMTLAHFRMLIHELLNKYLDMVPE